jgi:phosphohistidine phosphatase
MRHARATDTDGNGKDYFRPLTADGREMASESGRILDSLNLPVDRIVASAALRTSQTADLVAAELTRSSASKPVGIPITRVPELYHASANDFAYAARQFASDDEATVLVVGHNPGIGALMCFWADQPMNIHPATLIAFRFAAESWSDIRPSLDSGAELLAIVQEGQLKHASSSIKPSRKD